MLRLAADFTATSFLLPKLIAVVWFHHHGYASEIRVRWSSYKNWSRSYTLGFKVRFINSRGFEWKVCSCWFLRRPHWRNIVFASPVQEISFILSLQKSWSIIVLIMSDESFFKFPGELGFDGMILKLFLIVSLIADS